MDAFGDDRTTAFSNLGGEFTISDGILRNTEARARSDHFRAEGQGTLDLRSLDLDYGISLMLVEVFETQSDELLEWLEGRSVPLRLHGPLTSPELDSDFGSEAEDAGG